MKEGGKKKKDSLIKESKKISHDNDDSPGQSDDDLLDLVHSLGGVLDFWNTRTQSRSLKPSQDQTTWHQRDLVQI